MGAQVETSTGRIEGETRGAHQRFLGIPFAAPPTGSGRFRAPRPPLPWTGVRDARRYGPGAPQGRSGLPGLDVAEQSEDCLTLNVFTPESGSGRRPVLVWIHGGGFTQGSASQAMYDGGALCERGDVVVVTIQYRLGALGYLQLPRADANLGQLDQIAALRWVRDNIGRFGGDPASVTVFGESAGGSAVATLLAMPAAAGLFRRAIAQSGAAAHTMQPADSERLAETFARELGLQASDLEKLQEFPVEAILEAQRKTVLALQGETRRLTFSPGLDPATLPIDPHEAIARGAARDIALLVGTNRDEAKLFRLRERDRAPLDAPALLRRVRSALELSGADPAHAERLISAYRAAREGAAADRLDDVFDALESDRMFRIPAIRLAEAQHAHCRDTFMYLFTWCSPAAGGALGACHALELPFVFGTLATSGMEGFAGKGPDADALSAAMMDAWLAFARGGDPCHPGLPAWPRYEPLRRSTLLFDASSAVAHDPLGAERAAWSEIASGH